MEVTVSAEVHADLAEEATAKGPAKKPTKKVIQVGQGSNQEGKRRKGSSFEARCLQMMEHELRNEVDDEAMLFCKSLAASLRKLDNRKGTLAKIRLQQVLYDIQVEILPPVAPLAQYHMQQSQNLPMYPSRSNDNLNLNAQAGGDHVATHFQYEMHSNLPNIPHAMPAYNNQSTVVTQVNGQEMRQL